MTTVPIFGTETITAVDLDLDVIRRHDGTVFVDDEDEFTEHRELYGYPVDVVEPQIEPGRHNDLPYTPKPWK
jgi:protein associated with RNAse G/E